MPTSIPSPVPLKTSPAGRQAIKNREGLRLSTYCCSSGVNTIGYGHTGSVKPGQQITEEQAEKWFESDISIAERVVREAVKVPLTQNQFDVLVSFVFNVGKGKPDTKGKNNGTGFLGSTLLIALNAGYPQSVPTQLARWVRDGNGRVVPGLKTRRQSEITQWNGGLVKKETR